MNRKQKGTNWERDFVKILSESIAGSEVKRMPTSGAIGTTISLPTLQADVTATFTGFPQKFKFECKVGYGGEKNLTVQREWFNTTKEVANNSYSIPAIACKFSGARKADGVQYFVAFDLETFINLMNYVDDLKRELDLNYE